ncbi:hypothetical protein HN014_14340 [Aquimarina sp. TRL1]|uniref:hypothetical protein n=1 Tax=Aquimarina sp. (strain TRL1) TaxID=2736252 RepID=UPI00158ADCE9|nr:hypothetical protein [Aquimarina sp. TRL1]QKX06034.1 hypothetical protein HN014_14340 [Aquimarina sp. TRL1]
MKKRYLKILQALPVYADHENNAKKILTLIPQELIPFNREKRRNGINWMEIYLENDKIGYIKKLPGAFYKCEQVSLDDESVKGFSYSYRTDNTEEQLPMDRLFFPQGYLNPDKEQIGTIKLECIEKAEENKMSYIDLEYPAALIDVEEIRFRKGDKFYITHKSDDKHDIFMEVDNFLGKQGFLLKKTNTSNLEDKWMYSISITIAILTVLGIFLGFLANGWIVVSGLMILVGIVVAFIFVFVLQIILMILKGIFNQIRKRF